MFLIKTELMLIDPKMQVSQLLFINALLTTCVLVADGSWVLTFEDNFEGDTINTSKWTVAHNDTVKSQYDGHDAWFVADAVAVSSGHLSITAWLEPQTHGGVNYNMSSGWIDSQQKFNQTNGRFEASMKMPDRYAMGAWPAWWLLPEGLSWPVGGEVDIIEWYGGDNGHFQHSAPGNPSSMASTYHYGYSAGMDASSYDRDSRWYPNTTDFTAPIIDFSAGFHTFGVEVNATAIRFYVDMVTSFVLPLPTLCVSDVGFEWGRSPYLPWAPLYGIINLAVLPNTNTTWWLTNKATLLVDWVRAFEWV